MPRGRNVQPQPKTKFAQTQPGPAAAPRRKHPWLLALVIIVLAGWISFLGWLALFE
jgi:hypothetical protein